ncbi:hypothetical protein Q5Y75_23450 [Ruegeria sp. 2205SS24-7]|uniref:hypothetical protein n=1 Tax=Ruegeria discodermiae TaxID=3064389 RepID=UPI002741338A|nr:hypothetical protein [Ruegeria sp. 2205SS24-7]MDP5220154.1 hypothetical protein [Ruegeria sp. 2205SS24-7]
MKALADAIPTAGLISLIPESSQVLAVTELRLNEATPRKTPSPSPKWPPHRPFRSCLPLSLC